MTAAEKRDHLVLIAINVAIIIVAESFGGGSYFFDTRLIQGVAILFMILPLIRIFTDYRVYDPTITRVIQASLVALLIFTESHATAYAGHFFFSLTDDTLQTLVANFYIAGLLTLVIGAEMVLAKIVKRPRLFIWLPTLAYLGLAAGSLADAAGVIRPSLHEQSMLPLGYAVAVSVVAALGFVSFNRLRSHLPLLKGFVEYIMAGAAFIVVSAVISFFLFILAEDFGVPGFRLAYIGAFSFFIAVSLMYLAFGKLKGFGGIYKDLREEDARG